jgi:hypothetical protein
MLHDIYSSPSNFGGIISMKMRGVRHVAEMGDGRTWRILI